MKSLSRLLVFFLSLAAATPALSALSVITGNTAQGGATPSAALSSSIGVGQAVVAIVQGGTIPASSSVADNVNSGNYTLCGSYSGNNMAVYMKVTNASGTPTVTLTGDGGYSYISVFGITGFAGTPTCDTAIQNTATGTGTTATISATSKANNEVMIVNQDVNNFIGSVTVSGWSPVVSGNTIQGGFYAIEATSGSANNFSGTWTSGSSTWYLQLSGIYDASGPSVRPSQFFMGD